MAAAAVFETYELLEHTLLHLPIKDLLLCQRVCKQWQALVQRSQPARKALFMEPVARDDDRHCQCKSRYDVLTRKCQPLWLNPLFPYIPAHAHGSIRNLELSHFGLVAPVNTENSDRGLDSGEMGTHFMAASWKGMLLTQPPPGKLVLTCEKGKSSAEYDLQEGQGHGTRFGGVVEQLRAH